MGKIYSIYGIADRNRFKYPGFVHDHNFCIIQDERIESYLHLERLTRIKYDNRLQDHLEDYLLSSDSNIPEPESVFLFVNSFVGSSFISKNGRIRFDGFNPNGDLLAPAKGYCWIQKSDWEGFEVAAYSISHEIAHAFSVVAFAGGLRDNSLLIAFDGGASRGNFAAFQYKDGKLTQLESHWNLSHLSKLYNDNGLTFGILNAQPGEHCVVPGKLMGYASWGKPHIDIQDWLIDNDYFKSSWGERTDFIQKAREQFKWNGSFSENKDPFLFDVAAAMQETFRTGILEKIRNLQEETGADYLYYGGGCALNILANAELVNDQWFKDVYISPCCNDSGLSIGAAAYWNFLKGKELKTTTPYLNNWDCREEYSFSSEDVRATADAILRDEVVGISNGNAEAGPRALGNRSIIAKADSKVLSRKVSMTIKEREWYRPIAPIMLEKSARIVTGFKKIHNLSKYMLLDFKILPEYNKYLEGVVHTNGTARIQTIFDEKENPFLYHLLKYLDEEHGVTALINTSFNGKGEPIVQTVEDARYSAKKMNLDAIVLNGKFEKL